METYLESCEGKEKEKCVFKREHRFLNSENRPAKKPRDRQAKYMFTREQELEKEAYSQFLRLVDS